MKIRTLFILGLSLVFASCQNNNGENQDTNEEAYLSIKKMNIDELSAEIKKREKALNEDTITSDGSLAAELKEVYVVYANRFSNHENAADYLFKAGELSMGLNHTSDALKYFEKVYKEFPDYDKRPYALFLRAFVLENQVQEYSQAAVLYEMFIEKFPNHAMADDAEYSLKNLGKSPEELIREFEIQDSIRAAQEAA